MSMTKPIQTEYKMSGDFREMVSNGRMARHLGVDPKTLRKWAIQGRIPSYVNPVNGYRYYNEPELRLALRLNQEISQSSIDEQTLPN
jgi:hypothetical protein